MTRQLVPLSFAALFVGTILAANAAVQAFPAVPVAPGLMAPAGVYFAGVAFVLRDLLQETAPRSTPWVIGAILVGTVVALLLGQGRIGLASGGAFLFSETADFLAFSAVRRRGQLAAMVASNVVGAVLDSLLFLAVAFGSLTYLPGQVAGKLWVTLAVVVVYLPARRALLSRHA